MERVILHSDANSFYASVECARNPSIRDKPVAVCGDPEARHGIVLTKNEHAKKFGVKTGEAIWQAKQKCPNLVIVPPDYPKYVSVSREMRRIYESYTDMVEAFGLDENWLDLSQPSFNIKDGERIAHEIRERIKKEIGITVSVGVSFNKVFAKLGSDYKKPDAVTVITQENFKKIVWPLPVSDLIYVGAHTTVKLMNMGILTIGQLANTDTETLRRRFGVNGVMLKAFSMGLDHSRVMQSDEKEVIKSIGNSSTPPHDIKTPIEAKSMIYVLSESVAARLRENGFRAKCVSISVRDTELQCAGCQRTLKRATRLSGEIARSAFEMFSERYAHLLPLRSMGVSCTALVRDDAPEQLDIFGECMKAHREEDLEDAIDGLRGRFGHQVVRRGIVLFDSAFSEMNPKEEQTIHPVAFLREESLKYKAPPETAHG
ncbi:MAG: DNA polymerase IV [Clostridia bacterium]|nr:DNA polymerase IV [Clostridia bacterium]